MTKDDEEQPKQPWQHIAMDFMAMPKKGKRKQILIVVDRFSKMSKLIPLSVNATVDDIYHAVFSLWSSRNDNL